MGRWSLAPAIAEGFREAESRAKWRSIPKGENVSTGAL
jgi:hypothetical protein